MEPFRKFWMSTHSKACRKGICLFDNCRTGFFPPRKKSCWLERLQFLSHLSWKIKGLAGAPFLLIWIKSSSCTCNHNAFLVLAGIDETVRAWCLRLNKSSLLSWLDLLWIVIKVIKNGLSQWGGCLSWLKL